MASDGNLVVELKLFSIRVQKVILHFMLSSYWTVKPDLLSLMILGFFSPLFLVGGGGGVLNFIVCFGMHFKKFIVKIMLFGNSILSVNGALQDFAVSFPCTSLLGSFIISWIISSSLFHVFSVFGIPASQNSSWIFLSFLPIFPPLSLLVCFLGDSFNS